MFSKPVAQLAGQRHSVRTFLNGEIASEILNGLSQLLEEAPGVNGRPVYFRRIEAKDNGAGKKLGTYGTIKGAENFITAAVPENEPDSLLELGYRLERAVLYLTSYGLGSVWLGGTFDRSGFKEAAGVGSGERLIIVLPFGYGAEKPRVLEKMMKQVAGSAKRRPWAELFFEGSAPLDRMAAGDFQPALEAVRLAPSAMNSQPWRIYRENGEYRFYESGRSSGGFDMHLIDMGIALCHFDLAASEAGHPGRFFFERPEGSGVPRNLRFIASWRES